MIIFGSGFLLNLLKIIFIMKKFIIMIFVFSLAHTSFSQNESEVTTYLLIRHAEKEKSNFEDKNPHLNELGFKRALRWSQIFKDIDIDSVYTTNYNRTLETANPTAASHHLKPIFYNPSDVDYVKFKEKTKGKTVLIVGHSNTIPNFVNSLIGQEKYSQIADSNYANLYIVTLIGYEISAIQLYVK